MGVLMSTTGNNATDSDSPVLSKIVDVLSGRKIVRSTDKARFYLGWGASVCAVCTAVVLAWGASTENFELKTWVIPFLVFWTVVPPMYFWFDYFVLWHIERRSGCVDSACDDLDAFKHGQEVSRNLWLAIVALLVAIYKSE